jgi:hypothetical protein
MTFYLIDRSGYERIDGQSRIDQEIAAALPPRRPADISPPTFGGSVQVLDSEQEIDEPLVHRMLREDGRDSTITWSFGNVKHSFATAPGVDRLHHFVNAYLEGFAPFKANNIFTPLYTLAKVKTYEYDRLNLTGHRELWQSSRQAFYYKRGDCEDHALALADWLIEMGEDARVVAGSVDNVGHAWVILFKDGKEYLFEATSKQPNLRQLSLASMHPDYHPKWMFNREYFWYNTGSARTVRYQSDRWQRRSRYSK